MTLRLMRPETTVETQNRPRRRWRDKFGEAFRGIKIGVRGQSSFFVHFFIATLALLTAAVVQCEWSEWCLLAGCIGLVMTAEMFNSALAAVCRGQENARPTAALQIASGAVLMASCTAAVVGVLVIGRRLWLYLS